MCKRSVVHELFTKFSSHYPRVQEIELQYLMSVWDSLKASPKLQAKITDVASGNLTHCGPILSEILKRTTT